MESNGRVQAGSVVKETWVVVTSDGQNYIGCARVLQETGEPYEGNPKQEIFRRLQRHGWLTLMPAFEFHCPMVNDGMQTQRRAMLMPPDFVLGNQKLPVHLRVDRIYFIDDMEESDKKKHMEMISAAEKHIERMGSTARAQAAGLQLVPASEMPKEPGRA